MGANYLHGIRCAMSLQFGIETSRCYKATVNESETITAAKPVQAERSRAPGCMFPGWPPVERS